MAPPANGQTLESLAHTIHFGEQVAQLMHLGAVAFVISAAYVGLDKLGKDHEAFRAKLDATCSGVGAWLVPLDLKNANWESKKIFLTHEVFVLVMVARLPLNLPWWPRTKHCLWRQPKLPLLNFIREKRDARVMSVLCILNLLALLIVAAVGMWPQHADLLLAARPVWIPVAIFIALALTHAFYGFRRGFERTKILIKWAVRLAGLAIIAAFLFPDRAYHIIYWVAPQLDLFCYSLFAGTLCFTVFVSACSTVLDEAKSTLEAYKAAMEKHLADMRAVLVADVDTKLASDRPGIIEPPD